VDLLSTLYGRRDVPRGDGTNRRVIHATTGMVTATLRRSWGVEAILREAVPSYNGESKGKPRTDHRHHAVDAIVIALTSQSVVQQMSVAAANAPSWQSERRSFRSLESPWPNFVDSIRPSVTGMIVSHRPEHKMSGPLHKETIYGQPYVFEGRSVVNLRRSIQGITPAQVMEIPDPAVRQAVETKISEHGGDSSKFNPEDVRTLPSLVTNKGEHIPIRKVRIRETKNADALLELPGKRFVQSDEIHHFELFVQREGRKEVWVHYPVTLMEAYSRRRRNLPIVSRELEDDPSAEFLFSLMKGDMVEMDYGGQREVFRVKKFYSAGPIWFAGANNAQPDKDQQRDKTRWSKNANALRQLRPRKVLIDLLGNLHPAND
jgi:CRISPR-associated endonuclease Csn1